MTTTDRTNINQAYSEPGQTFNIGLFAKIINGWSLFTILAKSSILGAW